MILTRTLITASILLVFSAVIALPVDQKTARTVGLNFYYQKVHFSKNIKLSDISISSESATYNGNEALYYIFGFTSGGFVIVAADDACVPVIAWSANDNIPSGEQPDGYVWWMENVKAQILYAKENNLKPDTKRASLWKFYTAASAEQLKTNPTKDIQPLCSSTWAQGKYYNMMCPLAAGGPDGRAVVGCVATAMSQIMYYWRYPMQGSGQHNGIDYGATYYRWNEMSDNISSYNYGIAELCYHAGKSVGMIYSANGSAAFSFAVPNGMKTYFRYSDSINYAARSNYTDSTWAALLRSNLDSLRPVFYSASDTVAGGHAWVCDGYQGTDYFHMNWGWGGNANGFFYLNNLTAGGYHFTINQAAVYNIYPEAAYPYYCQADTTHLPYTQGSFEDGSAQTNYMNNADCMWLIEPQDPVVTIFLNFTDFSTEAGHDSVIIYDGDNTSAPVLGSFSGTNLPAGVASSGNRMLVCFRSNDSISDAGWKASYYCTYPVFCYSTTYLTAASADFDDGSGSGNYPYNESCRWRIRPVNAAAIELSFTEFDIATDDYIKITDEDSGIELATLSGDSIPPAALYWSSKLLVFFKTNSIFNAGGFSAHYKTYYSGMNENQISSSFSLFPNPALDNVHLDFTTTLNETIIVEIFTASGQQVFSSSYDNYTDSAINIDITNLAGGIYLLRLKSPSESLVRKLVVGNR